MTTRRCNCGRMVCFATAILMVSLSGGPLWAQSRGGHHALPPRVPGSVMQPPVFFSPVPGTTVQLPTFHFTTVATTVVVPDRGGAYLGGVGRSNSSTVQRGLPLVPGGNRAIQAGGAAGGMSVHAWIHDFDAMDQALLQKAAAERGGAADANGRPLPSAQANSTFWEEAAETQLPLTSVAEAQRQRDEKHQARQQEFDAYLEKARALRSEGREGIAKIYYQMALRRATGDLKQEIAAELAQSGRAPLAAGVRRGDGDRLPSAR